MYPVWPMIAWSILWHWRGLCPTEREDGAWGEAGGHVLVTERLEANLLVSAEV